MSSTDRVAGEAVRRAMRMGAELASTTMRRAVVVASLSTVALTSGVAVDESHAQTPPTAVGAQTWSFGCGGGPTTLTVPAGVTTLGVDLIGAQGAPARSGGAGGGGGRVVGTLPVTPGTVIDIVVGCAGRGSHAGFAAGGEGGRATPGAGWETGYDGGDGGGATGISIGGEPLMVAGGGGGGGGDPGASLTVGAAGGIGGQGGPVAGDGGKGICGLDPGPRDCDPRLVGGRGGGAAQGAGDPGQSVRPGPFAGFPGAGGGGGGGYPRGGAGGPIGAPEQGGGGGGAGDSFAAVAVQDAIVVQGLGIGDGRADFTTGAVGAAAFACGYSEFTVPAGITELDVEAYGGRGGTPTDNNGSGNGNGAGGLGAAVTTTIGVTPGQTLYVWPGCAGQRQGGNGYWPGGNGGDGRSTSAIDGHGGGGASAVGPLLGPQQFGDPFVVAGGGGGGGGAGFLGTGGRGGNAGQAGRNGTQTGGGGGGCSGCTGVPFGTPGGSASSASSAGGAGGGGAGWGNYPNGGGGGDGGNAGGLGGGGGGGGGGGVSYSEAAATISLSNLPNDGQIILLWGIDPPATTSLVVDKTVTGGAAETFGRGPFTMVVHCELSGSVVLDSTFTLGPSARRQLDGLPVGASCSVTETGSGGASTPAAPQVVPSLAASANRVAMVNDFALSQLDVTVATTGASPDFTIPGYTVTVSCSFNGRAVPLVDGGVLTFPVAATTRSVGGVPTGARCRVDETVTAGATRVQYGVTNPDVGPQDAAPTFTVGAGTSTVTVTNTFSSASLTVTKTVTGSPPPNVAPPTVAVVCAFNGGPVAISPTSFSLASGASQVIDDIPVGSSCTVDETDASGATTTSYSPARTVVLVAAGARVDVTNDYETGSLVVSKTVSGSGAGDADAGYRATVECRLDGELTGTYVLDFPVGGGRSTQSLPAIDAGSECRVAEDDTGDGGATATSYRVGGRTSPSAPSVVVSADAAVAVAIDNEFTAVPLRLVVTNTGPGADRANTITVTSIRCTFNGSTIRDQVVLFPAQGGTVDAVTVPIGSVCDVSHDDDGGATQRSYAVVNGQGTTIDGSATTTVLAPASGVPTTVTVTDLFELAPLQLDKIVEGPSRWAANTDTTAAVACTFNGWPLDDIGAGGVAHVQFTPDGTPIASAGAEALRTLPVNAVCRVSEPLSGGATSVTFEPDGTTPDRSGPVVVTSVADDVAPARAAITNTFADTALTVDKVLAGGGRVDQAATEFVIDVTCAFNGLTLPAPPGSEPGFYTRRLRGGTTARLAALPQGAVCTTTEVDSGGATSVAVSPSSPVVLGPAEAVVTVTNTFDVGTVTITKVLTGAGADQYGGPGSYVVEVLCQRVVAGRLVEQPLADGGTRTLSAANDFRATIERVPVGAECSSDELDDGLATSTRRDGPVAVTAAGPNELTVINRFDLATVRLTKQVTGAAPPDASFGFAVTCTATSNGRTDVPIETLDPGDRAFTLVAGESRTVTALGGARCALNETEAAGAAATTFTATAGTLDGSVVTLDARRPADVVVTNVFADPPPSTTTTTPATTSPTTTTTNPRTATTTTRPTAASGAGTRPSARGGSGRLARTGGDATDLVAVATAATIGGAALAIGTRRRRRS